MTRKPPTTPPALVQLHVRIDPALFRRLKIRVAETGVTLQDLVVAFCERGLRKKGGAR